MRSILSTLLLSSLLLSSLMADFYPPTVSSEVTNLKGNKITLSRPLLYKGMSGIIIHNYGSKLEAISNYITYQGGNRATTQAFEPIAHDELPVAGVVSIVAGTLVVD